MTNKFAFATQKIAWIQDKCYTWYNIHIGKKCHKHNGVILTINECEDGASNDNIINKLIMLQPHSRCIIRSTHRQRTRLIHSLKIFKLFTSFFFFTVYTAVWYNTHNGNWSKPITNLRCTESGKLNITAPSFTNDIAILLDLTG